MVIDESDGTREPIGIVTDRDIVVEVIAKGHDPQRAHISELMTSPLVVASASEDVAAAIDRMRAHGVRRLPVVDDQGAVFGILTLDDLCRALAEHTAALAAIISKEQTRENRGRR